MKDKMYNLWPLEIGQSFLLTKKLNCVNALHGRTISYESERSEREETLRENEHKKGFQRMEKNKPNELVDI